MALMSPFQQAYNVDTNLTFAPPIQLDTSSYSGNSPNGEANQANGSSIIDGPSNNYTPPAGVLTSQQQRQEQAKLVAQDIQQNQQNQGAAQQSPYGMSPSTIGSIAGKATNALSGGSTFSNQVYALNKFGANTIGLMSPDTSMALSAGLSGGDASALGSSVSAVNAAGDSVVAGSPEAIGTVTGVDSAGTAITSGTGGLSSSVLGGATASGIFTAGAIGAIGGGMLAKALGENQLGGSIGGGVGAAAGMAFGAAGAAALGMELGAFAGPIGALVGGTIGAVAGGLFGNKTKPTNASGYNAVFNSTGNIVGDTTGGKHPNGVSASTVSSTANNFSQIMQAASQQLGIKFAPGLSLQANYSSKYGGANLQVGQDHKPLMSYVSYDQNDPASIGAAYKQALQAAAQASGYTDMTTLNSWFDKMSQGGGNGPQAAPSIPVSSSFAQFVQSKQGTSNAGNGSATPTVAPAH